MEHSPQEIQETEDYAITLLGIASRYQREGSHLYAFVIYDTLAKVNFTRQGQAMFGEVSTQAHLAPREVYEKVEAKLQKIVDSPNFKKEMIPRANALSVLADAKIALKKYEDAETLLEKAATIYTAEDANQHLGRTVCVQGLVAVWKKEFKLAIETFTKGTSLSEIKPQEVSFPAWWTESRPLPAAEEISLFSPVGAVS